MTLEWKMKKMTKFKLKKAKKEVLEEDAMKDTDFMKLDTDKKECYATWQAYQNDDENTCKGKCKGEK